MFGPNGISGATLTTDGLTVVFVANDGASADIYYANRASLTAPFSAPLPVTGMNSAMGDYEPSLRDDGCELFFARDTGPSTKWDIYSITLQ